MFDCAAQADTDEQVCKNTFGKRDARVATLSGHLALLVHAPSMDMLISTVLYIHIYMCTHTARSASPYILGSDIVIIALAASAMGKTLLLRLVAWQLSRFLTWKRLPSAAESVASNLVVGVSRLGPLIPLLGG